MIYHRKIDAKSLNEAFHEDLVPGGVRGRIAGYMIFRRASRLWSAFLRELAAVRCERSFRPEVANRVSCLKYF